MPRVTTVVKARKDAGKCGRCNQSIKAGETYFWWSVMMGSRGVRKIRCAKCRPRPSDLTSSDKLSRIYAAQESVEDILGGAPDNFITFRDDVVQALNDCAQEIREVGEEYGESYDNMPEGLQQGETGQRCEEMRDNCEQWADALESAAREIESMEDEQPEPDEADKREGETEEEPPEPDYQQIIDAAEGALSEISA